jgi:hypothetical protein
LVLAFPKEVLPYFVRTSFGRAALAIIELYLLLDNFCMKKLLVILSCFVFLSSCQDGWIQEDKDAFYEACMDDANSWAGDPAKSKLYCECVLIKVMAKYPNVNDALDNIELLSRDPDIQTCKIPILK